MCKDDCGFGPGFAFKGFPFGPGRHGSWGGHRGGRRQQMFESGEMKFVILRLLKEKPRYGYEVIKALEEKLAGYYTPSAGTVYPTLQLLEDVRPLVAEPPARRKRGRPSSGSSRGALGGEPDPSQRHVGGHDPLRVGLLDRERPDLHAAQGRAVPTEGLRDRPHVRARADPEV